MAHIEGPEEGDRDGEVGRPGEASSGSGAGRSLARPRARGGVARPAHTHAHTGTHATVGGGRQLRAARAPDGGYMLCPGKPGERWARALGTRRRQRACQLGDQSKSGPPAQSVSAAAGGTRGPARTILTAAPPAARAPATQLGAAGARGPFGEGAEPAAAARWGRGRGRPAAHRGRPLGKDCWEEAGRRAHGVRGERRALFPPSLAQGFAEAAGPTPLFWDGRRRFRASCVTSVCTAALTSVGVSSRTAIGREPLRSSPHPHPQTGRPRPLRSRKQGSAGRPTWVPCCLSGAVQMCGPWVVWSCVLT